MDEKLRRHRPRPRTGHPHCCSRSEPQCRQGIAHYPFLHKVEHMTNWYLKKTAQLRHKAATPMSPTLLPSTGSSIRLPTMPLITNSLSVPQMMHGRDSPRVKKIISRTLIAPLRIADHLKRWNTQRNSEFKEVYPWDTEMGRTTATGKRKHN